MKIILTERQYNIVKEQKSKEPSLNQVPQITSDYLGKGGGFERANKIGGGNLEKQIQSLKKIPPGKIKKVALVFPNKVWYEEFGTAIMNALGVISGWFRSLPEAIGYVNQLEKEGVKTDQLIIGSHGGGQELLITQQEGQFKFNNLTLIIFNVYLGLLHITLHNLSKLNLTSLIFSFINKFFIIIN